MTLGDREDILATKRIEERRARENVERIKVFSPETTPEGMEAWLVAISQLTDALECEISGCSAPWTQVSGRACYCDDHAAEEHVINQDAVVTGGKHGDRRV